MRVKPFTAFRLAATLLIIAAGSLDHAVGAVTKEYKLKAAFIYNFAKFVEWPAACFSNAGSPIVIGILGRNPFGDEMANTVKGRSVRGRAIKIRNVTIAAEAKGVHILFVSMGEEKNFSALKNPRGSGVLSVGESALFIKHGGTINFHQEGNKLRFGINMAAADLSGLKISSQLQKLASAIHR